MTNRIAFILAGVIIAAILLDIAVNGSDAVLFVMRKMVDLVEYVAFWR